MILPALKPQTALLGLCSDDKNHEETIINYFLLVFKLYVYNSREKHCLSLLDLFTAMKEIKKTEYRLSSRSGNKRKIHKNKWHVTHEKLAVEKS